MPTIITRNAGSARAYGFSNSGYWPQIPYQSILVNQWQNGMGGCSCGVNNLYVQIGSKYGITATATGWAADWGNAGGGSIGNWSPSGWTSGGSVVTNNTLATAANIVDQTTGIPVASFTGSGVNTYASGRDTNALRARTTWNSSTSTFHLYIDYDCKGGGTGWGTVFYSNDLAVVWTPYPV